MTTYVGDKIDRQCPACRLIHPCTFATECVRCKTPLEVKKDAPDWLKDADGRDARCAACETPVEDDPKIPRVLYFQSWCKFIFCEECWGFGNARWFPGARKLLDKLISIGAIVPEYWPSDLKVMLERIPKR